MTIDTLNVHTPQGHSGRLFIGADQHYVLRYDPEVNPDSAISLLIPVRTEEYRRRELAPAYDIVNTTAYLPEDSLALELAGNKSLFAARLGILDFAHTCGIDSPHTRIQKLLLSVETVFKRETELCEQVPHVVKAITESAHGFAQVFCKS